MGLKKSKFALVKTGSELSEENALPQVMLLLNRYDIDIEAIEDEKEKATTEKMIKNFLKAVVNQKMEVFEEDGQVKVKQFIQHRSEGSTVKELVFSELEGKHQSAMGTDGSQYDQILDLMISMCEAENAEFVIKKLKSSDLKNIEYLGLIFLAQ